MLRHIDITILVAYTLNNRPKWPVKTFAKEFNLKAKAGIIKKIREE